MIVVAVFCGIIFFVGRAVHKSVNKTIEANGLPEVESSSANYRSYDSRRDLSDAQFFARASNVAMIFALVVFSLFSVIFTLVKSVHSVDAGHVGIVRQFGNIVGQRNPGLSLTWPWQDFEQFNVQIQAIKPDDKCRNGQDNCMEAFSIDTQNVFVRPTLNMHVDKANVQTLIASVGEDYINKLVKPRLNQFFKDETVKYPSTELAPKREQIRQDVRAKLSDELAKYSIDVDDLLLENFAFSDQFEQAIEDKVKAQQDAITEFNKVQIETNKAEQAKQQGIAEANRLRETAQGQADANAKISASLTPELIQFQLIQKLADNISVMLLPAGGNSLFDVSKLLPQTQTTAP